MKARLFLLALLPPLLAVSATAQQKKSKVTPPAAMIAVWGSDAEACKGEPIESENRLEVEKDGVSQYVSYRGVRNWQRNGDTYSGRATLAEEGEGKPTPGRYHVALRLLPDGRLEVRLDRGKAYYWVKCPPGTRIR